MFKHVSDGGKIVGFSLGINLTDDGNRHNREISSNNDAPGITLR